MSQYFFGDAMSWKRLDWNDYLFFTNIGNNLWTIFTEKSIRKGRWVLLIQHLKYIWYKYKKINKWPMRKIPIYKVIHKSCFRLSNNCVVVDLHRPSNCWRRRLDKLNTCNKNLCYLCNFIFTYEEILPMFG